MHRRDDITRFRCHVGRIRVESGQRPSEDLYASQQRSMFVNQDEDTSAEPAKPTSAGRRCREGLKVDLHAERAGYRDEFVEKSVRVHP